jgi:hypothetical protein
MQHEPQIDAACRVLGVDCDRYLAQQRPYLTTDEVKQLQAAGFTIGAHSVTHARLGTQQREVKGKDHSPTLDDRRSTRESLDSLGTDNGQRTTNRP